MVIVLLAHAAVTPAGKPVAVPIPVAPVVVWVIAGLSAVLIHKVLAALLVTVLFGLTVKGKVLLHPSVVLVYVNVTDPTATPVTNPAFVIVATNVLLLAHVPPVAGVTLAVEPIHTADAPPSAGAPGIAFTATFADAGDVQPLMFVTVNV